MSEREKERERQRKRERKRQRKRDTKKEREKEIELERKSERVREKESEREKEPFSQQNRRTELCVSGGRLQAKRRIHFVPEAIGSISFPTLVECKASLMGL